MFPREKQFANLLTKQGKKWQYSKRRFNLGDTTYWNKKRKLAPRRAGA